LIVRSVVASAKEFGKIIGELDPAAATARDAQLRAELKSGKAETIRQKFIPDLVGGLIAHGTKLAGRLFVQPLVRAAHGQVRRLDDLLKPEFAIFSATHATVSAISEASLSSWQQLGGERVVIAASGESSNRGGVMTVVEDGRLFVDWMRKNAVEAVIVRPDRYVFGGARDVVQLNMLIKNLIEELGGRS